MSTRAALRYAKAILNFAVDQKKEAEVNDDMLLIAKTIEDSKDLQLLLKSPILKATLKKAALKEIFASKISTASYGLIDVLIENKRLVLLSDVARKYTIIYDALIGKEVARVTSAVPLTKELETQVLAKVKEITGKTASIENTVDPTIIGGFILRIGDIQYNASVADKLQTLKRQFDNESYISKL